MDLMSSTMKSLYSTRVSQLHYHSIIIKSSFYTWSISFITLSLHGFQNIYNPSHIYDILPLRNIPFKLWIRYLEKQSFISINSVSTDNCNYSHTYLCTTQNKSKNSINTNRSYISAQTIPNQDNVSHWNTSTTFPKVFYYQEMIVCIAVRNNNLSNSPFPSLFYSHPRQHFTLSFLYMSFFTAPVIMNTYVYQ